MNKISGLGLLIGLFTLVGCGGSANVKQDDDISFVERLVPIGKVVNDMSPRQVELLCENESEQAFERVCSKYRGGCGGARGKLFTPPWLQEALNQKRDAFQACAALRGYELKLMPVLKGQPAYPESYYQVPNSSATVNSSSPEQDAFMQKALSADPPVKCGDKPAAVKSVNPDGSVTYTCNY